MAEPRIFFLFLLFPNLIVATEPRDPCKWPWTETIRVQVAFVYDKTGTFFHLRNKFADQCERIFKAVREDFPHSDFAITKFSDYSNWTRPLDLDRSEHFGLPDSTDGDCYQRHLTFTKSHQTFSYAIRNIEGRYGGDEYVESSLSAVALTAADRQLGWIRTQYDSEGLQVVRVIVLGTDEKGTEKVKYEHGRTPMKGDGTDTCYTALPPDVDTMERVLRENSIKSVVGMYARANRGNGVTSDTMRFYDRYFKDKYLYDYSSFYLVNNEIDSRVVAQIKEGIREVIRCVDPDPPPYNILGF